MPASRSVVSALVRALGDLLYSLKAGPAARQPPHGHGELAAPCAAGGTAHSSPWLAAPMGFEQQLDQWREFYMAVAGAAAVLLGLVFIALSLQLEKAEAPGVPVLGLGSQALINLIYVLLLSLGMLVPYRPPVLPGIVVLAVAVVGLNDSMTTLRRARRTPEPPLTIRDLAVPVLLPIGWFGLLVVGGVGVIARRPFGLYRLAAGSAALIASATWNTWDLLVFGRTQGLE
jgi:hypothetical protein